MASLYVAKGECPLCICDELQPRESSRLGGITEVLRRVCGVSRIPFWTVVTWLILPVVICLSQRLSHACLSINKFVLWNCEWLIKSVIVYLMITYYMDNCGNSRANTCIKQPQLLGGVYLLDKKPTRLAAPLVIHNNFSNRMALCRRCFIQISALSTFDGRIEAYHGFDG